MVTNILLASIFFCVANIWLELAITPKRKIYAILMSIAADVWLVVLVFEWIFGAK